MNRLPEAGVSPSTTANAASRARSASSSSSRRVLGPFGGLGAFLPLALASARSAAAFTCAGNSRFERGRAARPGSTATLACFFADLRATAHVPLGFYQLPDAHVTLPGRLDDTTPAEAVQAVRHRRSYLPAHMQAHFLVSWPAPALCDRGLYEVEQLLLPLRQWAGRWCVNGVAHDPAESNCNFFNSTMEPPAVIGG